MKKLIYLIIYITLCLVASCSDNPSYHIGVSQCSEDDWRALLNIEIEREARFFGDIDIENIAANDNSQQQIADIEHFVKEGKDLIIVAPNVAEDIQPAIEKAYDKGIPVILIDRRIRGNKYNAFIGADNKSIGQAVGEYICQHAKKTTRQHRRAARTTRLYTRTRTTSRLCQRHLLSPLNPRLCSCQLE